MSTLISRYCTHSMLPMRPTACTPVHNRAGHMLDRAWAEPCLEQPEQGPDHPERSHPPARPSPGTPSPCLLPSHFAPVPPQPPPPPPGPPPYRLGGSSLSTVLAFRFPAFLLDGLGSTGASSSSSSAAASASLSGTMAGVTTRCRFGFGFSSESSAFLLPLPFSFFFSFSFGSSSALAFPVPLAFPFPLDFPLSGFPSSSTSSAPLRFTLASPVSPVDPVPFPSTVPSRLPSPFPFAATRNTLANAFLGTPPILTGPDVEPDAMSAPGPFVALPVWTALLDVPLAEIIGTLLVMTHVSEQLYDLPMGAEGTATDGTGDCTGAGPGTAETVSQISIKRGIMRSMLYMPV